MADRPDLVCVFIGYEPKEEVAFHVLQRSIHEHSLLPASVMSISFARLKSMFIRVGAYP